VSAIHRRFAYKYALLGQMIFGKAKLTGFCAALGADAVIDNDSQKR
jgi:hypothetical protein